MSDKEKFSLKKLITGAFTLVDGKKWGQTIGKIIDIRMWILVALVCTGIYIHLLNKAYTKALGEKPVVVSWNYDKEVRIQLLEDRYLVKPANSQKLFIKQEPSGEILKEIAVQDIATMKKDLRPWALELEPIGIIGYNAWNSNGDPTDFEGGGGLSFLRFYQMNADAFLTNKGIYTGVSYDLDSIGWDNSALGVGYGFGYKKKEKRALVYFRVRF